MPAITSTDLENAKTDVDHLAAIANSTALTATDRLGRTKRTLAGLEAEFPNAAANAAAAQAAATQAVNEAQSAATAVNLAFQEATNAQAARTGAEAARDAALIQSGVFADVAAGVAGVATGQYFKVAGSNGIAATEYKKSLSKNLFNAATVRAGYYVNSVNGAITAAAGWGCSAFIPVVAGQQYTVSGTRSRYGIAYFSAASDSAVIAESYNASELPLTTTAPAGATHMAINLYSATSGPVFSNVQVEQGSAATAYHAFGELYGEPVTQYPSVQAIDAVAARVTALEGQAGNTAAVDSINARISVYSNTSAGLAAVAAGERFRVAGSGDSAQTEYIKKTSPNIFNTAAIQAGYYLGNTGTGNVSAAPGWGCSAFIPVTAGKTYTLSGTRGREGLQFYSAANAASAIAGSYNGSTTMPLTVTAPAGATHVVFNVYSAASPSYSNLQFEEGSTATAYSVYGSTISELAASFASTGATNSLGARVTSLEALASTATRAKLVLAGTGDVESYIEATRDGKVIRRTFRPFPATSKTTPSTFDFRSDRVDGLILKTINDDAAPYRALGTTIGANHGYAMFSVPCAGHGKTQADIGSIYSGGGEEWVIISVINADSLHIARRSSNSSTAAPAGTYTRISGGVNTGSINVTASGTYAQLYPPFINRSISVVVDGVRVNETTASLTYQRDVAFVESYDIIERADVIAWYEASGAGGGSQPTGTPAISVSISYVFDHEGQCTVYTDFLARKNGISLTDIMFVMAQKMNTAVDGTVKYYIPKALPLTHEGVSYDYANLGSSDTTAWTTRLDFTPARCDPSGILCDRVVQLTDNYGFALGCLPVQSTSIANRRANATVKALQINNSGGKIYMAAIDKGSVTLNAGDYFSTIAYRNIVLRNPARTSHYAVRTNGSDYLYVDWHSATTDRVPVPADFVGRSFEIVEKSANVAVMSQALTNSLVVNVTSAASYGYLILKVL